MCFFNSALGRYYSLHSFLVFGLWAALAAWWQQQSGDLALSAYFYDTATQQFPYALQPFIYAFGKYWIWFLPFAGAAVWLALAQSQQNITRSLYRRVAGFFFSAPLLVGGLKQFTAMPRPMHLLEFGGDRIMPSTFWASGFAEGAGALPSVHATCGFIFMAFYYIGWVRQNTVWRWGGLVLGVALGLGFGFLRIMQGYHTLSQVLWAGAVVWLYASLWFLPSLKQAGCISLAPRCDRG